MKKLMEANDENKWDVKQMIIQKDKEIKKIRDESQNMIDEIVGSYKL